MSTPDGISTSDPYAVELRYVSADLRLRKGYERFVVLGHLSNIPEDDTRLKVSLNVGLLERYYLGAE